MGELDGKVAVITGGARGQGRSHALALAAVGADLVLADICADIDTVRYPLATKDDLAETVRLVEQLGRRAVAVQADVRSSAEMARMADTAIAEFGRIDILLANAGIHGVAATTYEVDDEAWDNMIAVNLSGVWRACKAVIPHMIAGGRGGAIVITSSVDGLRPAPSWGHYGAAKGGLQALMSTLAFELAPENIRVNTVNPTGVNSPMAEGLGPLVGDYLGRWSNNTDRANLLAGVRMVDAEDISRAILYLVGEAGRYITGTALPVDAGYCVKH